MHEILSDVDTETFRPPIFENVGRLNIKPSLRNEALRILGERGGTNARNICIR